MKKFPTATAQACALLAAGCVSLAPAPRFAQAADPYPTLRTEQLYRLARYLHGQQKYDEALRAYTQVLAREPGHVDALNATGALHSLSGNSQLAEEAFRRAIAQAPKAARSYNNLGYHYLRTGRPSEALTVLQQAKSLDPADEQVQVNLAMARGNLDATAQQAQPAPAATAPVEPALHEPPQPTVALARINEGVYEIRSLPTPVAKAATAVEQRPAPVAARVEVSNGNGARGLARRVAQLVAPQSRLTNARPFNTAATRIQYTAGFEQAARDLGERLPVAVPVVPVARLQGANVRVLLGKDFPGSPAHGAIALSEMALPSHP